MFRLDLNLTRQISISPGWTCKWWECEGLKRDYFEDLLRQLSPNTLEAIRCCWIASLRNSSLQSSVFSTPIRNLDQITIIGELRNLRRVHLDLLKPVLSRSYLPHLTRLRYLDSIHLDGFETFDLEHFTTITASCHLITTFSFPRGTPWAGEDFLLMEFQILLFGWSVCFLKFYS